MIDKARRNGIICNYCNTEDPEEADRLFDMGIDTVLTNSCWLIMQVWKHHGNSSPKST
jgi:glycerophosphoryl diester phosphodiesterase